MEFYYEHRGELMEWKHTGTGSREEVRRFCGKKALAGQLGVKAATLYDRSVFVWFGLWLGIMDPARRAGKLDSTRWKRIKEEIDVFGQLDSLDADGEARYYALLIEATRAPGGPRS